MRRDRAGQALKRHTLVMSALVVACGRTEVTEPAHEDKLDAALRAAMCNDTRVPVLILGSHQLMMGADAFSGFTRANAGANRLELRSRVLSDLRAIAEDQRAALLDESWPAAARGTGLWLINAAFALLTPGEVERAATRSEVAYLYLLPAGLPPAAATGSATPVASNSEPFTADGKRIAWNIERIGAPSAWAEGVTGAGVVAALIDNARAHHPFRPAQPYLAESGRGGRQRRR